MMTVKILILLQIILLASTEAFGAWSEPVLLDTVSASRPVSYIAARGDTLMVLYQPNRFVRSLDGGLMWQDQFVFPEGELDERNQNKLKGDTLVVFTTVYNQFIGDSVLMYYSTDFGEQWQGPQLCSDMVSNDIHSSNCAAQELSICSIDYPIDTLISLLFRNSTDFGQHWSEPETVWTFQRWVTPFLCSYFGRPYILLEGDQAITGCTIKLIYSADDGVNWNLEDSLGDAGDSPYLSMDAGADGKMAFSFQDWLSWEGETSNIFVCTSIDSGVTWSGATLVSDYPFCMRPRVAVKNDTVIVCYDTRLDSVYYSASLLVRRSYDFGVNWLPSEIVADSACCGDLNIDDGKIRATFWGKQDGTWGYYYTYWATETRINDEIKSPESISLLENYPNPFNSHTVITYHLEKKTDVMLSIFDMNGRRVAKFIGDQQNAGDHSVVWDASRYASGTYLARLECGGGSAQTKLILIK